MNGGHNTKPVDGAEVRFLKLCLSARWDDGALDAARALAAHENLDWAEVSRVAARERVAPLLHRATLGSGLVPESAGAELRDAYYLTAARNLRLLHQVEPMLSGLEAAGVPAMLLKGAALIQEVYAQPALRPMADVDLLVRGEDVPRARRVLGALGYVAPCPALREDDLQVYAHALFLARPEAPKEGLDLHWSLFGSRYYYYRVPMDWFWQTSTTARVGNAPCRVMGPAGQMLHLCAHVLRHSAAGEVRLAAFHDVAAVIACYGERMDWDELLSRAQAFDLVLAVRQVLSRLQGEWRVALPDAVTARLGALEPSPGEERVFAQLTTVSHHAQGVWSELGHMPGWGARLRMVRSALFPSAEYMRWRYGIARRWLVPLYYPYRWLGNLRGGRQRAPLLPGGRSAQATTDGKQST